MVVALLPSWRQVLMYKRMVVARLPSWRWVLLFLVVAGLVSAVVVLASDETKWEHVVIAVLVVVAGVGLLSQFYALLPFKDKRICYKDPDAKAETHHLAYITEDEMETLLLPLDQGGEHEGLGKSMPGLFGTQGVRCFPKKKKKKVQPIKAKATLSETNLLLGFAAGAEHAISYDEEQEETQPFGVTEHGDVYLAGWREWVRMPRSGIPWIKAKLDTGARSSSIHALDIRLSGARVSFWVQPREERLGAISSLAEQDEVHIGDHDPVHVECPIHARRNVTSSCGTTQERIVVLLDIVILGRVVTAEVSLSDRSDMPFRMLIGREALENGFVVDSQSEYLGLKPWWFGHRRIS
jgi:hypothetical protein